MMGLLIATIGIIIFILLLKDSWKQFVIRKRGITQQAKVLGEVQVSYGGPMCQGDVPREVMIAAEIVETKEKIDVYAMLRPSEMQVLQRGMMIEVVRKDHQAVLSPMTECSLRRA